MESKLYRGQGPIMWEEKLSNGSYGPIKDLGPLTAANFSPTAEELKHRESRSGKRAVDKVIETTTDCTVSLTIENFSLESLGLHLRSDVVTTDAGSETAYAIGTLASMEVGDIFRIPFLGISDLVISDTTAVTPVVLAEGVHYEPVATTAHGYFKLLSKAGITGDLKGAFDYLERKTVKAMSKKKVTGRVTFLGVNTAEDDEPRTVQALVTLTAANAFPLINDDFGTFEVNAECLYNAGGFFTVDGVVAA